MSMTRMASRKTPALKSTAKPRNGAGGCPSKQSTAHHVSYAVATRARPVLADDANRQDGAENAEEGEQDREGCGSI